MQRISKRAALFALLACITLVSCGRPAQLRVDDTIVTLSPVDSNPSGLYFTVHGGPDDVHLISVVTNAALRTEMHESGMDMKTGMMTMKPLTRVLIPAKGKVAFKQGGKHVMVWGINMVARRLGEMPTEFVFSNGDRIIVTVPVRELDGSEPDERKAVT